MDSYIFLSGLFQVNKKHFQVIHSKLRFKFLNFFKKNFRYFQNCIIVHVFFNCTVFIITVLRFTVVSLIKHYFIYNFLKNWIFLTYCNYFYVKNISKHLNFKCIKQKYNNYL